MKNILIISIMTFLVSCQDKLNIEPNYFSIPYFEASYEWNGKTYSGNNNNRNLVFEAYQNRGQDVNVKKDTFSISYQFFGDGYKLDMGIYNIPLVVGKYKIFSSGYNLLGATRYKSPKTIGSLSARDNDILLFNSDIDTTSTINFIEITRYDSAKAIVEGNFAADFKLEKVGSYIKADSFYRVRNGIFKAKLL
jgi:hypothetical protein